MALLLAALGCLPAAAAQDAEWPAGRYNPYEREPIRVFLDVSNLTAQTRPYADEVRAALAYWEEGGNLALSWRPDFLEVDSMADADILVWFEAAPSVSCGGEPATGCGGYGVPGIPGEVWLSTRQEVAPYAAPQGGALARPPQDMPYDVLQRVAKHELGHALGLPHSPIAGDVMSQDWHGFTTNGDVPGSLLRQDTVMTLLGVLCGAIALAAGGHWGYHKVLSRKAARVAMPPGPKTPARDARRVPVEPRPRQEGPYLRGLPPCPKSPSGEHRFELRTSQGDAGPTTWSVCTLCRLPRRL